MLERLNLQSSFEYAGQPLQRGDVLVFGGSRHFAMATGQRTPSGAEQMVHILNGPVETRDLREYLAGAGECLITVLRDPWSKL